MDAFKAIVFLSFIALTACNSTPPSNDDVKNYKAEGNLKPFEPIDCASADELANTMNPVDVFIGLNKCLRSENYSNAAELYFSGMTYGYFDTLRVSDKTAHQAISVLRFNLLGSLDQKALEDFQTALKKISEDNTKLCQNLEDLGPPMYQPEYMIQHGMGTFSGSNNSNGLIEGFNSEVSWKDSLATIANCGERVTKLIKVNTYFENKQKIWFKSHWGDKLVKEADPKTFKPLSGGWGVDAKHVFYTEDLVAEAAPSTFEVMDFSTGKDDKHVYRAGKKCDICDVETFVALDFDWYKDKNSVFQRTVKLEDADPDSFVVLSDWFSKDKRYAYENSLKIIGADAESFKLRQCGISKVSAQDKNRCYSGRNAIPCDCDAHKKYRFPFVGRTLPSNKSLINLIHQRKYKVEQVGDFKVTAKLNATVPSGNKVVTYSCKHNENVLEELHSVEFYLEPNRRYSIVDKKNALSECDSEIAPLTWFEGQNDLIQVSVKFFYPARASDEEEWSVSTELPETLTSITLVCRYTNRAELIQTEREISFTPVSGHFYSGHGKLDSSGTFCEAELFDETVGEPVSL